MPGKSIGNTKYLVLIRTDRLQAKFCPNFSVNPCPPHATHAEKAKTTAILTVATLEIPKIENTP